MTEIEFLTILLQYTGMILTVVGVFFTSGKTPVSRHIGFVCSCTGCMVWIGWGIMVALSTSLIAVCGIIITNLVVFTFSIRGVLNNKTMNARDIL